MASQDNLAKRTKFRVILNGMPLGFSKVSNISSTMEFETVVEGGGKVGKISAVVFNQKDPAAVVKAVEGGYSFFSVLPLPMPDKAAAPSR